MSATQTSGPMVEPKWCDLVVQNGCILSMNPERAIYPEGAIAISGGGILDVAPNRKIHENYRGRRVIDARGGVIHPGYIDTHVHCTLMNSRGAFPDSLDWQRGMEFYTAWWNGTEDEDEYASALHCFMEMLRNGTTCLMEAGTALEPDVVAAAMESAGIRGLVADSWLWDLETYPGASGMKRRPVDRKRSFQKLGEQLARNRNEAGLVRGHVAIYGMGTCSDDLILAAKDTADRNGSTINQHQSFMVKDAEEDDGRLGRHPLVHHEEMGALGPTSLYVHMNALREDEIEAVVRSGMAVTWCLTSSMIWGAGGTFHGCHDQLHKRGVRVALGSDSGNSALRFDLNQQAVLTVLTSRDKRSQRDALGPEDALEMLTISAAKAIGMGSTIGSIEPGKRADIVIRSRNTPEAQPCLDEVQSLVLSQGAKSVDTVLVDGRVVVKNGRHTMLDEELVQARVRESARRMLNRIGMTVTSAWPRIE